jgi:1-acyl-sn-glycerol-3-phosphate acyltransferase
MKSVKQLAGHVFAVYAIVVFVATMLVVWLPIFLISLLQEPTRAKLLHFAFRIWMGAYMPLIGCPVRRRGKEHFRDGDNYVVVLNHNSLLDIPVSSPWIPGPNKTLAKAEMAKVPLFGVIYKAGSILVDRKNEASRRGSFGKMQEALESGLHLCLYPEGTRNKTKQPLQPFFDGAFNTAIKAQKPIIPGLIFNTAQILPHNKKFWLWPQPIHIHFLEPIPTAGLTANDVVMLKNRIHSIMEQYLISNRPTL